MKRSYNDVEVGEEMLANLDPEEEPTTPATEAVTEEGEPEKESVGDPEKEPVGDPEKEPVEEPEKEAAKPLTFAYKGKEYTEEGLQAAIDDHLNKADWSKSNTQKAQQISKVRKLVELVKGNEDLQAHLKDYPDDSIADAIEAITGLEFEEEAGESKKVDDAELKEVKDKLDELLREKNQAAVIAEFENFVEKEEHSPYFKDKDGQLSSEKVKEFLDFMNAEDEVSFGKAFKLWTYGDVQKQAVRRGKEKENAARNEGAKTDVKKSPGVTKTKDSPKKPARYEDITFENYPELKEQLSA